MNFSIDLSKSIKMLTDIFNGIAVNVYIDLEEHMDVFFSFNYIHLK